VLPITIEALSRPTFTNLPWKLWVKAWRCATMSSVRDFSGRKLAAKLPARGIQLPDESSEGGGRNSVSALELNGKSKELVLVLEPDGCGDLHAVSSRFGPEAGGGLPATIRSPVYHTG
jgi:hypothetical protein